MLLLHISFPVDIPATIADSLSFLFGVLWQQVLSLSALFAPAKVKGVWDTALEPSGTDISKIDPAAKRYEKVTLYQFFNKVWGIAELNSDRTVYKVRGQLFGEKLSLVFTTLSELTRGRFCSNLRRLIDSRVLK